MNRCLKNQTAPAPRRERKAPALKPAAPADWLASLAFPHCAGEASGLEWLLVPIPGEAHPAAQ
jgi:hypothetical protein